MYTGLKQKEWQAQQWRTVDIAVRTQKDYHRPFEDVDVYGTFTGPDGQVLKLLAFWDGDGTWILRFAPTQAGAWSFVLSATDENPDFSGEGSVQCIPYTGDLDIYKHGFLRVSEDKTHLTYADGTPFFWLGDTHWTFVTEERFDESNCPLYESQFKACVDRRVQQRFTVYQCNFRDGTGTGGFGRCIDLMHDTGDGFEPNLEEFHANVDKKMDYLADCGLVTAVGYAWCYDMAKSGLERYKKFAKYTMARYGAYPVIWTLAGELPGYGDGQEENLKNWGEVAKECERFSAYENLQSVHLACYRPFPKIYEKESWFDFAMSQAGHGDCDLGQEMYAQFVQMYAGHPVLESEAVYEGAYSGEYTHRVIPSSMMRRIAYLIMQSGGCGYTYGCNGVWELQWEAGVGGIGWGDMAWWDGLVLPGADQLTIFRDFYEEVGWANLRPLPKEQAGAIPLFMEVTGRTQIFFTADQELTTIVGYEQETAIRAFRISGLPDVKYCLWMMDPQTGERTQIEGLLQPRDGVIEYWPEKLMDRWTDAVVVLQAVQEEA